MWSYSYHINNFKGCARSQSFDKNSNSSLVKNRGVNIFFLVSSLIASSFGFIFIHPLVHTIVLCFRCQNEKMSVREGIN